MSFKTTLILIVLAVLALWVVRAAVRFSDARALARETVARTTPYNYATTGVGKTMVVLGDSTAYGVGAKTPEETTAGRVAHALSLVYVENLAESGAQTKDVLTQLHTARLPRYDIALIQVGANDIIYGTPRARAEKELRAVLETVTSLSSTTVLLTSGDIGNAPLWPWPLNYFYHMRTVQFRTTFMAVAKEFGVRYVDIFSKPDPFATDIPRYYAPDRLHLSGEGYGVWAQYIVEELQ